MGAHCLCGPSGERCPNLYFVISPDEIAYAGDGGLVESSIGFGGPMEVKGRNRQELLELWSTICRRKIDEAYEEYFKCLGLDTPPSL